MSTFETPFGDFDLRRFPPTKNPTLRAWDAADLYVLEWLAGADGPARSGRWCVLNDGFGALGVALHTLDPASISDSALAHRALRENLERNGIDVSSVRVEPCIGEPDPVDGVDESIDVLVVEVPKSGALLEDQLARLRPRLHAGSVVVGAGMTRHVHTSTIEAFERWVGPTRTSLARRKARLIHATPNLELEPGASPYPTRYRWSGIEVIEHAGVFSRGRVDAGTELLLKHLPDGRGIRAVADPGCGSGLLGTAFARRCTDASVHFTDASYRAVASARATFEGACPGRPATFRAGDALEGVEERSLDLVLCNPPFHDGHVIGDETAFRMFVQARRVLRPGGELRVVGNRHLEYHGKLKRVFGNARVVASNRKFVVLSAVRADR